MNTLSVRPCCNGVLIFWLQLKVICYIFSPRIFLFFFVSHIQIHTKSCVAYHSMLQYKQTYQPTKHSRKSQSLLKIFILFSRETFKWNSELSHIFYAKFARNYGKDALRALYILSYTLCLP